MRPESLSNLDLTVEEIRKIRDYNYELSKKMNKSDYISYINAGAERVKKEMAEYKAKKQPQ